MSDKPNDKKTEETKPAAAAAPTVEAGAPAKRNLTRESLELTLAARYEGEGKPKAEAKRLAAARALEMCPE